MNKVYLWDSKIKKFQDTIPVDIRGMAESLNVKVVEIDFQMISSDRRVMDKVICALFKFNRMKNSEDVSITLYLDSNLTIPNINYIIACVVSFRLLYSDYTKVNTFFLTSENDNDDIEMNVGMEKETEVVTTVIDYALQLIIPEKLFKEALDLNREERKTIESLAKSFNVPDRAMRSRIMKLLK